jgi:hypothetical protein
LRPFAVGVEAARGVKAVGWIVPRARVGVDEIGDPVVPQALVKKHLASVAQR